MGCRCSIRNAVSDADVASSMPSAMPMLTECRVDCYADGLKRPGGWLPGKPADTALAMATCRTMIHDAAMGACLAVSTVDRDYFARCTSAHYFFFR